MIKQLNTVNVVCTDDVNTTIISIKSWPDTKNGNKSAEKFFLEYIAEDNPLIEDVDHYLDDGFYECEQTPRTIMIIHSNTEKEIA